ncbi:RsmB/NOP family class I SAM-dependent RNA methyltransferase [Hyphomonas sp.]|uniref:RsmB/NOP family class I SAM-dependent RNA methyltransferase n=1 Tax=Hyphomonas sp. TaxID=87 RepID=UPI000C5475D9|nr:RsmB/NOP family class I SAM-dependent RNA methyltransferase [Hyphomonas sp.]MAU65907.1 rRNA methyltransferase [Hyphomonas sp.]
MSGALVRRAAADLLFLTLEKRRTLDQAMAESPSFGGLDGPDRAFARAIASAALRDLGRIDCALAPLLSRPLQAASPAIRALLRAGAVQLWRMDVPEHAAVSETVEAAKDWPDARSGGAFLNAVLRRAAAERPDLDALPVTAIWPDWLAAAFEDSLGADGAARLAAAQLGEPGIYLTAKGSAAAVAEVTGGELLTSGSVRAPGGPVEALAEYGSGDWWGQDPAAALPAKLLMGCASDGPDKSGIVMDKSGMVMGKSPEITAIDLCAAPGGKTLQLCAAGLDVIAVDRSKPRLKRLEENLTRTGLSAAIITADAETWRPETSADLLLLDAPCSALGTLRRHPEGAWIKRETDIARFPDVQYRLLKAATEMVRPGGTILYCVCTPLKAEGVDVVDRAIADGLVTRLPVTPEEAPGFADSITDHGDVLTLPGEGAEHDAFFMARLSPQR